MKGWAWEQGTNLPEQATATASTEVDVHVMVLAADWFLDKRFFQDLSINDDGIAILADGYFWGDTKVAELDAEFVEHEVLEVGIDTWTCISGNLETPWGGNVQMVQDGADKTTIPEESLGGKVVYAKGAAKSDVRDGLVKGKVCRKEGDENVATWPVFHVCDRRETSIRNEGRTADPRRG